MKLARGDFSVIAHKNLTLSPWLRPPHHLRLPISPCRWISQEALPFKRWNFACIDIPGPYENNLPSVYCIAPLDPSGKQQACVAGNAALLLVCAHEVWPVHFPHFLHANRARWAC